MVSLPLPTNLPYKSAIHVGKYIIHWVAGNKIQKTHHRILRGENEFTKKNGLINPGLPWKSKSTIKKNNKVFTKDYFLSREF